MVVALNLTRQYQTIDGFGGAITDSVAHVFAEELSAELQEEMLETIWGDSGLRYTLGRLTIGSTDFSVGSYSYDDQRGDYNMTHFSVAHDEQHILPLVKKAMAKAAQSGRKLQFVATPWSPPAWMKVRASTHRSTPHLPTVLLFW